MGEGPPGQNTYVRLHRPGGSSERAEYGIRACADAMRVCQRGRRSNTEIELQTVWAQTPASFDAGHAHLQSSGSWPSRYGGFH